MTESIIRRYPKVKNLGDRALKHLFDGEIELSSKLDGSNWRIYLDKNNLFELGTHNQEGVEMLKARIEMTKQNRGKHDMFDLAIEQSEKLIPKLKKIIQKYNLDNITLYTEYLRTETHGAIHYSRIPKNHLYLFGTISVKDGIERNLKTKGLIKLANYLDIEPVNILFEGEIHNPEDLEKYLNTDSVLGGTKIEGIVIKNYNQTYPIDLLSTQAYVGFPLMGKLVSDKFREVQDKSWKKQKIPVEDKIAEMYLTEARFTKAIQHLKEEGKITYEKKDLGVLIPEFINDLLSEEKETIEKMIADEFYEKFKRRCSSFVVHKYVDFLTQKQFQEEKNEIWK